MYLNKDLTKMLKRDYLSSAEITNIVIKYQRSRNQKKKQQYKDIVFENISRFIAKTASHYSSPRIDQEELFQAGVIGFCEALEKFKPKLGNMFTTYLKFWVSKSIYNALYGNNLIHTPRNVISYTNKKQRMEAEGKVVKYNKFSQAFINTANIVNLDNDNVNSLKEIIRSPIEIDVDVEKDMMKSDIFNLMDRHLDNREKRILKLRYLNNNESKATLAEVGKTMNLSMERIRQIEVLAISKLRKHI